MKSVPTTLAERAWDSFSNTMRRYTESSLTFGTLVLVDPEEAINNLDRAFEAKLEAFHSLYDATRDLPNFKYFDHADTSLVLALRNALHHRNHDLFKSWNKRMYEDRTLQSLRGAQFLLASYSGTTQLTSKYYLLLNDFYQRLQHAMIRDPNVLLQMWNIELSFSAIADKGRAERYPEQQIYVDVMPIFISAVARTVGWMALAGIRAVGFDGKTFAQHFSDIEVPDFKAPEFSEVRITF